MARYCKSCGSISKTQIPLFIAFNAVFLERSVFLSFCIAQTYIYVTRFGITSLNAKTKKIELATRGERASP